eukprot:9328159-Heterocapsa_arctica.AAC.1
MPGVRLPIIPVGGVAGHAVEDTNLLHVAVAAAGSTSDLQLEMLRELLLRVVQVIVCAQGRKVVAVHDAPKIPSGM